jgi:hypothetical protein
MPQELKDQMDAIGDQVNWSSVAASAFQAKVNEVQFRKGKKMSKSDVVKRLKALQEEGDQEEYEEGKDTGREWAERHAKPKELRRIADYIEECERRDADWWDIDSPAWNAPFGAVDYFAFAAWPSRKDERLGSESFWENALGPDNVHRLQDSDFFHGFGDGVVEVWDEVSDQL